VAALNRDVPALERLRNSVRRECAQQASGRWTKLAMRDQLALASAGLAFAGRPRFAADFFAAARFFAGPCFAGAAAPFDVAPAFS
jgi:hypothetical protein